MIRKSPWRKNSNTAKQFSKLSVECKDVVCASVTPDFGNTTDDDLWSGKGDGVSTDADAWWGW